MSKSIVYYSHGDEHLENPTSFQIVLGTHDLDNMVDGQTYRIEEIMRVCLYYLHI